MNVAALHGNVDQRRIVGQGLQRDARIGKGLHGFVQLIAEDRQYGQRLRPGVANGLRRLNRAAAGGDQILDDDNLLPRFDQTFDLILFAVPFGLIANVGHRQAQLLRSERRVRDAGRCRSGDHLGIRVRFANHGCKRFSDQVADFRVRHRKPVVAINRRLDT
ncbi:hypothetical protein D3C81_817880 [compost metagenome]